MSECRFFWTNLHKAVEKDPDCPVNGWDITPFVFDTSYDVSPQTSRPVGVAVPQDEGNLIIADGDFSAQTSYQYALSGGFSFDASEALNFFGTAAGLVLSVAEDRVYIFGLGPDTSQISQFALTVAGDITGGFTQLNTLFFFDGVINTNMRAIALSQDGAKLFVSDDSFVSGATVYSYSLGTANDVSTATYDGITWAPPSGSSVVGLAFDPTGTKMFALEATVAFFAGTTATIVQYTLSTPLDITTATADGVTMDVVADSGSVFNGLAFNADGTALYITDSGLATVLKYS